SFEDDPFVGIDRADYIGLILKVQGKPPMDCTFAVLFAACVSSCRNFYLRPQECRIRVGSSLYLC
ncbi:MAG: hypothetical protein ACRDD9_01990, partial [Shewanella sp.]